MKITSKQDIINSLLEYLPQITDHLQKLVDLLHSLNYDKVVDDTHLENVIKEITDIHKVVRVLLDSIDFSKLASKGLDYEIADMYFKSISDLLDGIKLMINWMKNRETEDDLRKSVDLLFEAGQEIMRLVEKITEK